VAADPFGEVSIKILCADRKRREMTCRSKLEPGAHIPFRKRPEIEQPLVLEESAEDHDGVANGCRLHVAHPRLAPREFLAERRGTVRGLSSAQTPRRYHAACETERF
jgi:hypothetical protein